MYKKEAAAALAILAGGWMEYCAHNKSFGTMILAFFFYFYWAMRMFYADYQKE